MHAYTGLLECSIVNLKLSYTPEGFVLIYFMTTFKLIIALKYFDCSISNDVKLFKKGNLLYNCACAKALYMMLTYSSSANINARTLIMLI